MSSVLPKDLESYIGSKKNLIKYTESILNNPLKNVKNDLDELYQISEILYDAHSEIEGFLAYRDSTTFNKNDKGAIYLFNTQLYDSWVTIENLIMVIDSRIPVLESVTDID